SKDIHNALAVGVGLYQIVEIQRRLAEKLVAALLAERHQPALNRSNAGSGDVAVLRLQIFRMLADVMQHGLQVFQVEKQQPILVGHLEYQRQHSSLGVVQVQQSPEEQWAHLRHCGTYRVPLLAKDIPERHRTRGGLEVVELEVLNAFSNLRRQ